MKYKDQKKKKKKEHLLTQNAFGLVKRKKKYGY